MSIRVVLVVAVMVGLLSARHAATQVIDTLTSWSGSTACGMFGEDPHDLNIMSYSAQSFRALNSVVESVEFAVGRMYQTDPNRGDHVEFHLLLAPLASSGDRPDLDGILFETGTLSTTSIPEPGQLVWDLFDVPVDVGVIPGEDYVWILDAFVVFDGDAGTGYVGCRGADHYADGEWLYFDDAQGSRESHDDVSWTGFSPGSDLAFRITFIPEPATLSLLGLGTLALLRRRR